MSPCPFYCRAHVSYDAHIENIHFCEHCALYCTNKQLHRCQRPSQRGGHVDHGKPKVDQTIFKELTRSHLGAMITYQYLPEEIFQDVSSIYTFLEPAIKKLLSQLLQIYTGMTVRVRIPIVLENSERNLIETCYFYSNDHDLFNTSSINDILYQTAANIIAKLNHFNEHGSSWMVREITAFEVIVGSLKLIPQTQARGYLKMPFTKQKHGYLNIKNTDSRCFQLCIAASRYRHEIKKNKLSLVCPNNYYPYFQFFDFSSISGSVDVFTDIPIFEERNRISVNVLTHKNEEIIISKPSNFNFLECVNLFLIHEESNGQQLHHFVLITNLNKFLCNGKKHKTYYCQKCFRHYNSKEIFEDHLTKNCEARFEPKIKYPNKNQVLEFKNLHMSLPYPFVIFFDWETSMEKIPSLAKQDDGSFVSAHINNSSMHLSEFKPVSYSLVIVRYFPTNLHVVACEYFDGENVMDHFFKRLFTWARTLLTFIRVTNNSARPTAEERARHDAATNCYFCGKIFGTKQRDRKAYHHDHCSNMYLHAVCMSCNLRIRYKQEIPAICHNAGGFDWHLIVQAMKSKYITAKDLKIIAKNTEKFITMTMTPHGFYIPPLKTDFDPPKEYNTRSKSLPEPSLDSFLDMNENYENFSSDDSGSDEEPEWGNRERKAKVKIKFLDSYQFLHASLAELVSNIREDGIDKFKLLPQCFPKLFKNKNIKPTNKNLDLLTRKLNFPYQYLKSKDMLKDGVPIPGKEYFNDNIKGTEISTDDCNLTQTIINTFQIKDFREYCKIYCLLDSIHLSEVWENFIQMGLDIYGLDANYCCSAPGFFWQCFLYSTKTKLEYITEDKKSMIDMITGGIRRGPCYTTKRWITANTERHSQTYDPTKERTQILYLDQNSLYAHAMLNKLPQSNFQYVPVDKLRNIDWSDPDIGNDGIGYILTVALKYPESIMDLTSDIPLAPENRIVQTSELSPQQIHLINLHHRNMKTITTTPRLLLTCYDKDKYTVHYKTLQYYLSMGMELTKIYEGISFIEKAYIKDYILANLERRRKAKSKTQKDFIKLSNNIIYGKCLQQVKNRIQVKICTSKAEAEHYISLPNFKSFKQLSPNLSIIILVPKKVLFDKPIYSGFAILEFSKLIYYTGYYQQLKKIFGARISCAYLDTDSAVTKIRDPDNTFYSDLVKNKQYFDFSKIPEDHEIFKLYSHIPDLRTFNSGISGIWKIESLDILEVISLRCKNYSIKYFNSKEEQKCTGIPKHSLVNCKHDFYRSVLQNNLLGRVEVRLIRSVNHKLCIILVNKIGFHTIDVKRVYPFPNNPINSLPLGHYMLRYMNV